MTLKKFPKLIIKLSDHGLYITLKKSISSRSVNRKLSTLKSYFKFLLREGLINLDPMQKILPPRSSKHLPVFIGARFNGFIVDEIDFGEGINAMRDKLIIELFYSTGIRLNELINIKVSDINFTTKTIKILGKRNKERFVPLTSDLSQTISNFVQLINSEHTKSNFIFVTNKGDKLYDKFVYRLVKIVP